MSYESAPDVAGRAPASSQDPDGNGVGVMSPIDPNRRGPSSPPAA
jgi:hypothetical protein